MAAKRAQLPRTYDGSTVVGTGIAPYLVVILVAIGMFRGSGALDFVIGGLEPWVPQNTGDTTNIVIEDTTIGIDIPPGDQAIIDITV